LGHSLKRFVRILISEKIEEYVHGKSSHYILVFRTTEEKNLDNMTTPGHAVKASIATEQAHAKLRL